MAAVHGGLAALLRAAAAHLAAGRAPPRDLLTSLLSLALGYGILAGSTLVKVPQLAAVVRGRSARGLNPLSFELETLGLAVAATYGFVLRLPLPAFGETVALLAQNLVLLALIYHYQRRSGRRAAAVGAALGGWAAAAVTGRLSRAAVAAAYDANNALLVLSRVPQVLQNFGAKSTGALSLATYGLNAAGSAARVFTSLHERAGASMVRGAVIATALNAVLVAQILAYRPARGAGARGRRGKRD